MDLTMKTKRVRIRVAIDDTGEWTAIPREFYFLDKETRRIFYVEADIPIPEKPEPQTIEGSVTDA